MATVYPGAAWRPCTNQSDTMSAHLGLILHVQEGTNDLTGEVNDPSSQASYTWVALQDGTLIQFCDADAHAWAQEDGNGTYNSVGTQGFSTAEAAVEKGHPASDGGPLTEAQCQAIAGLYRWGHDTYGWPYQLAEQPGQPGLGWHGMGGNAWGGHFDCPGDPRKAQRQHILDLAQGTTPAPSSPPAVPQEDDMPTLAVRAVHMNPDGSGDGLVLDSEGGLHPIGNVKPPQYEKQPPPYWAAAGAAIDFEVLNWSNPDGPAGVVLDAKGAVHPFGGAKVGAGGPYWNNAFVPPAPQV